jgi:hypothetical protein
LPSFPLTPARALLYGGLAVGVLDILKPIVFAAFRGVPATRVLQSVASGALGKSAFQGGLPVAALGLALHFFIAFTVFAIYYFASRWLPTLARHGYLWGPLYGIAVYFFMQFVVFPLSAIGSVKHPLPVLVDGIFTHILCVGLPTGLVTCEAARRANVSSGPSL